MHAYQKAILRVGIQLHVMSLRSSAYHLVLFVFYLFSVDTDEMLHFIPDFTVCKSTYLGVSPNSKGQLNCLDI